MAIIPTVIEVNNDAERHYDIFSLLLKERIINSCYDILENVYRANVDQDVKTKWEALVQIKMLNFYLKQALDKELITKKKFLSYGNHLLEIHNMISSWCEYEKSE